MLETKCVDEKFEMLVTNSGFWWQIKYIEKITNMTKVANIMILPPTSEISHHHKVTNITMSPTSLSPVVSDTFNSNDRFLLKLEENFKKGFLYFFWCRNRSNLSALASRHIHIFDFCFQNLFGRPVRSCSSFWLYNIYDQCSGSLFD